jgi:SlyX protein
MPDPQLPSERLTELEIQAAHIQRLYDHLNEVVTSQATLIDRLTRRLAKLEEQLQNLKVKSEPPIDPLDEKPPHY